jgi:chitosanase
MNDLQQKTARAIVNAFEGSSSQGNYAAIAVMAKDTGHLSYGRSQCSLGSGALGGLLTLYCRQPDARFAGVLQPYLPRVLAKDFSLDTDDAFKQLLVNAAADPVMRASQDKYFDDSYLLPACTSAQGKGLSTALAQAVAYDSCVQGGWYLLAKGMPAVSALGEQAWVGRYLEVRRAWLKSQNSAAANTTYRMDAFEAMITAGKWALELPLTAHGVVITAQSLGATAALAAGARRTLVLVKPYLQGDDVREVQAALKQKGQPISQPDGIYGPFTSQVAEDWKKTQGLAGKEDGVGPLTRAALGLPA